MNSLKIRANAKLNLFLDITGKKDNGYHTLKTVMQSIDLYDELDFTVSDGTGIEIFCDRSDIPCDSDNLVYQGITAVFAYAYFQPGCKITVNIKKNIPSGAGLGGGSADCAAAIIAINELFHVGLDLDELRTAAAMCGADVAFCIGGGTALCEGIGEEITQLKPLTGCDFAVVKPEISVSTPEAYRLFDEKGTVLGGDYMSFEDALQSGNIHSLGENLYNALEQSCELSEILAIKNKLKANGAFGAQMTGSGSAVFGIFDDENKAKASVEAAGCPFGGVYSPCEFGCIVVD